MEYIEYIKPELLILIPVLYLVGCGLKYAESVKDKHIPLYLGALCIFFALLYVFSSSNINNFQAGLMCIFVGLTQGVLCAGCAVYANQLYKQEINRNLVAERKYVHFALPGLTNISAGFCFQWRAGSRKLIYRKPLRLFMLSWLFFLTPAFYNIAEWDLIPNFFIRNNETTYTDHKSRLHLLFIHN